jgi:hypothetical protein
VDYGGQHNDLVNFERQGLTGLAGGCAQSLYLADQQV